MMMTKINEYFNITSAIFSHMEYEFQYATKEQLDILFFTNYGEKNVAPIVTTILSEIPTDEELNKLSALVLSLYSVKWNKLKNLLAINYDPIHNYEDKLVETIGITGAGTEVENNVFKDTKVSTGSNNQTRTDNLSASEEKTLNSTNDSVTDDGVYGFNSSSVSNSDKSTTNDTVASTATKTIENTGTQKNDAIISDNSTIDKTEGISKQYNNTNDKTRTSTHSGNIGNLTTQQLMNQEIELWKWNFINSILTDVKDFLTIPIYIYS